MTDCDCHTDAGRFAGEDELRRATERLQTGFTAVPAGVPPPRHQFALSVIPQIAYEPG